MLKQVSTALSEIAQAYSDTRVHCCQVAISALEADRCVLTGTVLDSATLEAVSRGLTARFPALAVDTQAVNILRGGPARRLMVVTNVTGLHAQASFLSEMLSQMLSGTMVELLRQEEGSDRWGFVRLPDGYLGRAYRPYLAEVQADQPTHLVCEPVGLLRCQPQSEAQIATRALAGTAVRVGSVSDGWAVLTLAGGLSGWLPRHHLRALSTEPWPEEATRERLVADAFRFIGVPYLWGGCTALGIDCSGFVQLLHRLAGLTLPRDADMQFGAGRPIEPPFRPGDLFFFGEAARGLTTPDRDRITHVGMSLGGWRMIHSSRARNGVYVDDVQAVAHLRESFAGARAFVGG